MLLWSVYVAARHKRRYRSFYGKIRKILVRRGAPRVKAKLRARAVLSFQEPFKMSRGLFLPVSSHVSGLVWRSISLLVLARHAEKVRRSC